MASYTIKDLEKLSGIKAHTIRIWEKRYSLISPERTSTNIRTYCDAELKKLLNISILNRNGIRISRIASLSTDEINIEISRLSEEKTNYKSHIENLSIAMIDLDENHFEKIISRTILKLGFEETMIRIIYPFFVHIGILWQTGSINPAQEHFITNLIRRKLIVAIDGQIMKENRKNKKFLLFLPEGELHELGLLFYSYLIRKRGHKVIYLGQTVPLNDIREIVKIQALDYLLTAIVSSKDHNKFNEFINDLSTSFKDKVIYLTGKQTENILHKLPENVTPVSSIDLFISELENINNM